MNTNTIPFPGVNTNTNNASSISLSSQVSNGNNLTGNADLEYTTYLKSVIQNSLENSLNNTNVLKPYRKVYINPKCSVCWNIFGEGTVAVVLPCGHMFHEECVLQWAKNHRVYECPCPQCRCPFFAKSGN